ncbi:DUF3800 domain-containing protein [Leptospira meyeri]|uniref:DUF3800 domain-containing protein n=1 Tax=Leptospira meyeri TaxID=29508 RepID=UPI0010836538|nr:DUF3800 domain-containing protein [Leptospira meyeri]TGM65863.1 DUF3800 domain-containing protein [Leptospira meyeri]TGM72076.1 DUF3800 domain-containing protein [Leptospira meyeri]
MNTHIAYSDESNWNSGRFRTIALISMEKQYHEDIINKLSSAIADSDVTEFKWKNLNGAKQRFLAEKKIRIFFNLLDEQKIRLDSIIWDINDTRHALQGRDDVQNLARMYYHLLRTAFKLKWQDAAIWKFIPDKFSDINWKELFEILNNVSVTIEGNEFNLENDQLFENNNEFGIYLKKHFHIHDISEGESKEEPLIQLADLFAGMCSFSWENYDKYELWLNQKDSMFESLFTMEHSKRDEERFKILKYFDDNCKNRKLYVSLKSHRGLISKDPKKPINIWKYVPQHEMDKAPTKIK